MLNLLHHGTNEKNKFKKIEEEKSFRIPNRRGSSMKIAWKQSFKRCTEKLAVHVCIY